MNLSYILVGVVVLVFLFIIISFVLKRMKGSIEIVPEKYSYTAGEKINGKLILKLKKPVKSDKLIIGLVCKRTQRTYSKNSSDNQYREDTLFDFSQPLDGKKEYSPLEYPYDFSIVIPLNVSQKLEGISNTLFKSAQILTGQNSMTKWYLYAELQCDGVNLSKNVQINII
jgi:hypothetical protein